MSLGLEFRGRGRGLTEANLLAAAADVDATVEDGLVRLCPGGEVELQLMPGRFLGPGQVEGSANTTAVGPGFHAAVVEFLARLQARSGVQWEVDDETSYWKQRDFGRLQEEHRAWLRALVDTVARPGLTSILVCWPLGGWTPVDRAGVVTPVGRFEASALRAELDGDGLISFADRFFTWNRRARDAQHLRGLALQAIWTEVRWTEPRTGEEADTRQRVVAWLEQARALEPDLPLPLDAWKELNPAADPDGPDLPLGDGFGYLRHDVSVLYPGGWRARLPGSLSATEEEDAEVVYWDEDRSFRLTAFRIAPGHPTPPLHESFRSAERTECRNGHEYRWGTCAEDERTILQGHVRTPDSLARVTLTSEPAWSDWVRETFLSVHRGDPAAAD